MKRKLVSFFSKIGKREVRNIKQWFGLEQKYNYETFSIMLPPDHKLPEYQRANINYDRFLPHLAKYLPHDSAVIDVGANCGDTLAGMVESNSLLQYICIEPDSFFYKKLLININSIKAAYPDIEIITKKYLVGKNIKNVSLEGTGGTKQAIVGGGSVNSVSLDQILSEIQTKPIKLLKSDVDGFDYDVLDSSESLLRRHKPIVYFECQCTQEYQLTEFKKTIQWLYSMGYLQWCVFDNFGTLVLDTNSPEVIYQLMDYVWRQNVVATTRTIYYFDILTSTSVDAALLKRVIAEY